MTNKKKERTTKISTVAINLTFRRNLLSINLHRKVYNNQQQTEVYNILLFTDSCRRSKRSTYSRPSSLGLSVSSPNLYTEQVFGYKLLLGVLIVFPQYLTEARFRLSPFTNIYSRFWDHFPRFSPYALGLHFLRILIGLLFHLAHATDIFPRFSTLAFVSDEFWLVCNLICPT